jgi:amino acid transporter
MDVENIVGSITDRVVNTASKHIKNKKNREKIMKNIIEPVLTDINKKYYPHYITVITLFIMMIIMLIILLIISLYSKK